MTRRKTLMAAVAGTGLAGLLGFGQRGQAADPVVYRVMHTDDEWQRLLTPAQFKILRRQGTEWPGSSPLDHEVRPGRYDCLGCDQPLYSAATKFDSHTGWPSFWQPLDGAVEISKDTTLFMTRNEVHCSTCGGHLGHVFDDGPRPTGLRYCMNGAVMAFRPDAA